MTPLDPRLQLPEKVVEALKAGNVALAVRLLRELKGIDLREARVTANFHAGTGIETLTYY